MTSRRSAPALARIVRRSLLAPALALLVLVPPGARGQSPPSSSTPAKPAAADHKPAPHPPQHAEARGEKKPAPVVRAKSTPARRPGHGKPTAAPAPAPVPPPAAPPAKEPAPPPEPQKGSATGLPLPRFAALRSDEVNLRSGPGTRYPIDWVYKRRDLPVEIEREFEVWRLVKDEDGVKGWVHQATLTGRRSVVVAGAERTLRRAPEPTAPAVAVLKPGVIVRLRSCQAGADWCEVQVGDYRGFLKRDEFWGSYPGEAVNP